MEVTNQVVLRLPEDINKLCRTCMAVTDNLICHNVSLTELDKLTLAGDMLETCSSLDIVIDNGLPTSICDDCANKLEIAYNFKSQCHQVDSNYRKLLNLPPKLIGFEPPATQHNHSIHSEYCKGVIFYENKSESTCSSNYEVDPSDAISINVLLEQKIFLNNTAQDVNSSLDTPLLSTNKDPSFQDNINKLAEYKEITNEIKNKTECNEIISLIQERKQFSSDPDNQNNFDKNSNNFIKTEYYSEEDEVTCKYCAKIFENTNQLHIHVDNCPDLIHNSEIQNGSVINNKLSAEFDKTASPYKCHVCNCYFKSKQARNNHIARHRTFGKNERINMTNEFTCDLCNKIFSTESKLATHFRRHASKIRKELEDKDIMETENDTNLDENLQCYICSENFFYLNDLNDHIEEQHTESNAVMCEICGRILQGEVNLVKHLRKHGIHLYVCKICQKRFESISKLKEHTKAHGTDHIRTIFNCPICKDIFSKVNHLRNHSIQHADDIFECSKCNRTFNNKVSYETHERQHKEPRFLCSFCGKRYFSNVTLACHIRSHNNEKPFVCPHCKKAFSSRATLSVHKRIHSSFKPYLCSFCDYSCRQSGDLAMHIRTHTGVKPYKCTFPNCDRKFTTSSQRKEHYRRHTNERNHKCISCGKAFLESKTLKVHMLTHTGEKPHECEVCGKRFRRTHHLSNHKKGHRNHE